MLSYGAEQTAGRICERQRGDQLVAVIDHYNAAALAGQPKPRRPWWNPW